MSALMSYNSDWNTSGAMYTGLPAIVPVISVASLEMPTSETLTELSSDSFKEKKNLTFSRIFWFFTIHSSGAAKAKAKLRDPIPPNLPCERRLHFRCVTAGVRKVARLLFTRELTQRKCSLCSQGTRNLKSREHSVFFSFWTTFTVLSSLPLNSFL